MAPGLFWLIAFFLLPLGFVGVLSFGERQGLVDVSVTGTLANYARAFDPLYLTVLLESIWIAGVTTVLCLAIGIPVALVIARAPARWKPFLLLLTVLPLWTNLLIRTYALMAVLRTRGFVNNTLEWVHESLGAVFSAVGLGLFSGRYEPLELLFNQGAVITGLVYYHLPFMVLPLFAALDRLDTSYLEASLDLGAGHWRTFFSITLPLAMPGVVSGIIITFIPALGTFLTPALLGGPDSQMIGNVIENQFKQANDWPFGAALSFLLMYATFAVLAIRALWTARAARSGVPVDGEGAV
ncbi:MAG: ABC transporter permease [Pseudomonadota bacterium]